MWLLLTSKTGIMKVVFHRRSSFTEGPESKQAEAEVVQSSSLVEVEVEVGVEVGDDVGVWIKMQFSFLTFPGGWLGWGGWRSQI